MRAATSSADQFAARSKATASRAHAKVPSGFGRRGQMWPLSMWVCMSAKAGKASPRSRSIREASAPLPAGSTVSIRPAETTMSAVTNPSPSAGPRLPPASAAGSVALAIV